MNFLPEKFDVVILGAGPAGISAAIRLMEMGHTVGLIEQEKFPRQQIGESLSPGIRNIFSYLQIENLLNETAYQSNLPAKVIWENKDVAFVNSEQRGPGIVVDRGIFDQQLLAIAAGKGLHIFQPAKLYSATYEKVIWQLKIKTGPGFKTIYSKIVLDARGRKGSLLNERLETAPPSVATWTHIPSSFLPRETFIEAIDEGWLWGSPVTGNRYRIMAFTDASLMKKTNLFTILSGLIAKTNLFAPVTNKITGKEIQTCSVTSFVHVQPWNNRFIKTGEAAFTLDPLSSTGVEKAMRFSMQTAIAINTLLKNNNAVIAQSYYEDKLIESAVTHIHWTASYYAAAWPSVKNLSFWKKRALFQLNESKCKNDFTRRLQIRFGQISPITEPEEKVHIDFAALAGSLWHKKIIISPQLIYKKEYAVSGDCVEIKQAIDHPGLKNSIIYIEDLEVIPLLKMINNGITFGSLVESWENITSLEKAKKIATFLWWHNIINIM
jgi:flavin-dependent dehydrogenase